MKKKICFVIYNRSNYARLKPILERIQKDSFFKLQIILTSSSVLNKYGNLQKILKKDKFKINYSFYSHIEGENNLTMTKSTSIIISELSTAFEKLKPDYVVTIGDRFETMATGICCSFMNIFLIHIQGGELTNSIDEKVRHSITKLSNLHFVCTKRSKKIVEQMGESKKNVYNVGCTSIDLIKKVNFRKKINLYKYNYGIGYKVDLNKKYFVVLIHPNTLFYKQNLDLVKNTFEAVLKLNNQIIWIWPNIDAGSDLISKYIRIQREKNKNLKINFFTNLEAEDYLKLVKNSSCLIGNTSSGIRECSFLGIPFVNIGNRQDNREKSKNVFDAKVNAKDILRKIYEAEKYKSKIKQSKLYGAGSSSLKIIKILKNIETSVYKKFQIRKI